MEFGKVDSISFWTDRVLEWNFPSYYVLHNYNRISAEPLALKGRLVRINQLISSFKGTMIRKTGSYSTTYS